MKQHCNDYEIIKRANINDDKISKLIRECIKPIMMDSLIGKIEKTPFSIIIAETIHKLSEKYFAIHHSTRIYLKLQSMLNVKKILFFFLRGFLFK